MENNNTLHFHVDLEEHPEQFENLAKKYYQKMKSEGKSLQEVMNISDNLLEEIYGVAYSYYNQGKYKEAISLFYYLISITPKNDRYLFGFAASLYQTKDFDGAAIGFYLAHSINPKDPITAFYAADSLLKINHTEEAIVFLNIAIDSAKKSAKHSSLLERCKLIKATLGK